MTSQQRQATKPVDYYRPIIADGDTGHGGLTAVMKLCKVSHFDTVCECIG